jgi:oligoendopeptidase F
MTQPATVGLDLSRIPAHQTRHFVPGEVDLTDPETVVGLCRGLLEREVGSVEAYERWLLDRSELDAALNEAGAVLYIRMTCQTDDEARAKAYRDFIEHVVPAVKPVANAIDRRCRRSIRPSAGR